MRLSRYAPHGLPRQPPNCGPRENSAPRSEHHATPARVRTQIEERQREFAQPPVGDRALEPPTGDHRPNHQARKAKARITAMAVVVVAHPKLRIAADARAECRKFIKAGVSSSAAKHLLLARRRSGATPAEPARQAPPRTRFHAYAGKRFGVAPRGETSASARPSLEAEAVGSWL